MSYIVVCTVLLMYMFPTLVAVQRVHPQRASIIIINTMLGWTGLGWLIALAWSLTPHNPQST
jgi:hypothetical protein